jgi:hypothetical protein
MYKRISAGFFIVALVFMLGACDRESNTSDIEEITSEKEVIEEDTDVEKTEANIEDEEANEKESEDSSISLEDASELYNFTEVINPSGDSGDNEFILVPKTGEGFSVVSVIKYDKLSIWNQTYEHCIDFQVSANEEIMTNFVENKASFSVIDSAGEEITDLISAIGNNGEYISVILTSDTDNFDDASYLLIGGFNYGKNDCKYILMPIE